MADTTTTPDQAPKSKGARIVQGIVTRDKNAQTRRVEIDFLVKHQMYGKFIKQKTVCYVHDEKNESHLGDTVEIQECRPMSKTKRWKLIRVLKLAPSRTLSNLEGAVAGKNEGQAQAKPAEEAKS